LARAGVSLASNLAVAATVTTENASRIKIAKAARDFILSVVAILNRSNDTIQFVNCSNDGLQLSSTIKLNVVLCAELSGDRRSMDVGFFLKEKN
jgi:hypothetical protein